MRTIPAAACLRIVALAAFVMIAIASISPPAAADNLWVGPGDGSGTGFWTVGSNWSSGYEPVAGENVAITWDAGTSMTVTYDSTLNPMLGRIFLNALGDGSSVTLSQGQGSLSAAQMTVGDNGSAVFTQNNGSVALGYGFGALILGARSEGMGTYNLGQTDPLLASTLAVSCEEYIGASGKGYFNQSGGTHTLSGAMYVGLGDGSYGQYTMIGGSLSASDHISLGTGDNNTSQGLFNLANGTVSAGYVHVGRNGTGTFTHTGGTLTTGNLVLAADSPGSNGTYNLSQSDPLVTSTLTVYGDTVVGNLGTGFFTNTGGTHTTGSLTVGGSGVLVVLDGDGAYVSHTAAQGNGTYTLNAAAPATGANLLVTGDLIIGNGGFGTFNHDNGTATVNGNLIIGRQAMYEVRNGAGDLITTEYLDGGGTYNLSAGILTTGKDAIIGDSAAGEFYQTGGTHTVLGTTFVGSLGSGTYTLEGGAHVTNGLTIGGSAGGTYNLVSGDLTVGTDPSNMGWFVLGGAADATMLQSGGTATINGPMFIGAGPGTTAYYQLDDGILTITHSEEVISGAGTTYFRQTGGTHNAAPSLFIGASGSESGTYYMDYGRLNGENVFVGENGTGYFTQTGGTVTLTGGMTLGRQTGGTGYYDLSGKGVLSTPDLVIGSAGTGYFTQNGGELRVAGNEHIGWTGTGTFTQTGGTHTVGGDLVLGNDPGSSGTFVLSGGDLLVAYNTYVGMNGTGTFTQDGGTHTIQNGALVIGSQAGSTGEYRLTGGTLTAVGLAIGESGTGTFTQEAGSTASVTNGLILSGHTSTTGVGRYYLNGGSLTTGYAHIGSWGTGTFTQSNGSHTTGTLIVGVEASGIGTYSLANGSLTTTTSIVGGAGTGTFNQTGGTHTVTGDLIISDNGSGNGTYNLKDGTLNVSGFINRGTFNYEGGTLNVTGALQNNGTFNSSVPLNIAAAVLSGSGTITGNVIISSGGTVSPGNSPGILTIAGDYTQDAASTLSIEILNKVVGTGYDRLSVSGLATLDGTVSLTLLGGYTVADGDTFTILHYGSRSGEFATWTGLDPAGSLYFTYAYGANDLVLTAHTAAPVPIPGAVWLFAPALGGLAALRKRFGSGRRRG